MNSVWAFCGERGNLGAHDKGEARRLKNSISVRVPMELKGAELSVVAKKPLIKGWSEGAVLKSNGEVPTVKGRSTFLKRSHTK